MKLRASTPNGDPGGNSLMSGKHKTGQVLLPAWRSHVLAHHLEIEESVDTKARVPAGAWIDPFVLTDNTEDTESYF